MKASEKRAALHATKELMSHPVAKIFCDPDISPALPSVLTRLTDNQYDSIDAWAKDIDSVWENALQRAPDQPNVANIVNLCRKLTLKARRRVDALGVSGWFSQLAAVRRKQLRLAASSPDVVRRVVGDAPDFRAMEGLDFLSEGPMTEKRLKEFMLDTNSVESETQLAEMLYIVKDRQPEIDCRGTEVWIDLTKLKYQTIWALDEYMKGALADKGSEQS